jgi:hypothetical protein
MRLVGKKVERMNRFGDSICIELSDNGKMKLSPGAMSRLNVTPTWNKIGFAYPENDTENLYIYVAPDNDGIAVSKQGIANTHAHNRDVRSTLELAATGVVNVYLNEDYKELSNWEGYRFYQVTSEENPWDAAVDNTDVDEEILDSTSIPGTEGGHQYYSEVEVVEGPTEVEAKEEEVVLEDYDPMDAF